MNNFLVLALLVAFSNAFMENDKGWMDWKHKFGKKIVFSNGKQEQSAYLNFKTYEQKVMIHNSDPNRSYNQGFNEYSIIDDETFIRKFCGTRTPPNLKQAIMSLSPKDYPGPRGNYTLNNLPTAVNYTKYFQPIQSQKNCGSCWAFAVGSGIENFIKNRDPTFARVISQSWFVDCDLESYGCQGGWPSNALNFAMNSSNNQAPDNVDYPYKYPTDADSMRFTCKNVTNNLIKLGMKGIIEPRTVTLKEMQLLVANHGHVIVAIDATDNFMKYKSGIFTDDSCASNTDYVNHAVVVVGYNKAKNFFTIRNSWGTSWGEKGYMRMSFGKDNRGICNILKYPVVVR